MLSLLYSTIHSVSVKYAKHAHAVSPYRLIQTGRGTMNVLSKKEKEKEFVNHLFVFCSAPLKLLETKYQKAQSQGVTVVLPLPSSFSILMAFLPSLLSFPFSARLEFRPFQDRARVPFTSSVPAFAAPGSGRSW